ncbi:MAG: hypothetical protein J1G04_00185 [Clostridiales bacterium]|nr:hypothetical protein [Clostridiales bacterium]
MDDRLEDRHDFRQTIKDANEMTSNGSAERKREKRLSDDRAYTALAITSAMGNNAFDATTANLIQLEMAQEMLYLFDPENDENLKRDKTD